MGNNRTSRKSAAKDKGFSNDYAPEKGTLAVFIDTDAKEIKMIPTDGIPYIFLHMKKFQLHIKKGNTISGREIEL